MIIFVYYVNGVLLYGLLIYESFSSQDVEVETKKEPLSRSDNREGEERPKRHKNGKPKTQERSISQAHPNRYPDKLSQLRHKIKSKQGLFN